MHVELGCHVELHLKRDEPRRSGAARIHHLLLRARDDSDARALLEGLKMLGDSFAQDLADLQTVTLETSDELKSDRVQVLLELLRTTCRVPVRHRRCEEAHKVALEAKQSTFRTPATMAVPAYRSRLLVVDLGEYLATRSTATQIFTGHCTNSYPSQQLGNPVTRALRSVDVRCGGVC